MAMAADAAVLSMSARVTALIEGQRKKTAPRPVDAGMDVVHDLHVAIMKSASADTDAKTKALKEFLHIKKQGMPPMPAGPTHNIFARCNACVALLRFGSPQVVRESAEDYQQKFTDVQGLGIERICKMLRKDHDELTSKHAEAVQAAEFAVKAAIAAAHELDACTRALRDAEDSCEKAIRVVMGMA